MLAGVIQLVLMTLLAAHLLMANIATGGPFICVWLQRKSAQGSAVAARLNRQMAGWSVVTLLFAAVTGLMQMTMVMQVYPGVFHSTVALVKASKYKASIAEIVFSLVCYLAYYILAKQGLAKATKGKRILAATLALVSGLNTAWHFPTLFALLGVFSTRPEVWANAQTFDVMKNIFDGEVLALSTHFLLASAAVSGLMLATLALLVAELTKVDEARRYARAGGLIAVVPTVLQLIVGVWLLMETDELARPLLMGRSTQATVIFLLAIITALMLMHRLASLALGRQKANGLRNAWMTLATTVWLMCAVQQLMRDHLYRVKAPQPVPAAEAPPAIEAPPAVAKPEAKPQ